MASETSGTASYLIGALLRYCNKLCYTDETITAQSTANSEVVAAKWPSLSTIGRRVATSNSVTGCRENVALCTGERTTK